MEHSTKPRADKRVIQIVRDCATAIIRIENCCPQGQRDGAQAFARKAEASECAFDFAKRYA